MWNPTVVSVTFEHLSEAKGFTAYLDVRSGAYKDAVEFQRMGRRVQVRVASGSQPLLQHVLNRLTMGDFLRFTVTNPRSMSA